MKSADVVKLLNLPESTLRKYAQDYAEYLSPFVGAHRHRDYSERDVQIMRLVLEMKAQRVKPDDIDATLSSLRAANWERLPQLDMQVQSIIPTPDNLITAQVDKSAMQREIDVLREMLVKAEERAERHIAAATADRDELLRRLHEAEQLVRLYESGKLKPSGQER